jgi:phosphotriesterase-related protein
MPSVETVRGPVDVGDLGTTLVHEHVFVVLPDVDPHRCSAAG